MTEKQKIFCDEYLVDLNATRAYKAAYTNVKNDNTAGVNANKLLRNAKISEYIQKRLDEKTDALIAKQNEVLIYFTEVMRNPDAPLAERTKAAVELAKRMIDIPNKHSNAQQGEEMKIMLDWTRDIEKGV